MLKVSGIFVAPAEIENCLLQHEAVVECAVIGYEAGDGLVKPKAFIVLREDRGSRPTPGFPAGQPGWGGTVREGAPTQSSGELAEELKDFVKVHLAPYKYPRWIDFVSSLPKNDRGKIDRKKLKQG